LNAIEEGSNKDTVTIRERDTEEQKRIKIKDVKKYLFAKKFLETNIKTFIKNDNKNYITHSQRKKKNSNQLRVEK
jgi:dolichyl-phosphate-mannose--protein O-mannosyl transferase